MKRLAEPMDDAKMNKLLDRQGEVQEKLDAVGGLGPGFAT